MIIREYILCGLIYYCVNLLIPSSHCHPFYKVPSNLLARGDDGYFFNVSIYHSCDLDIAMMQVLQAYYIYMHLFVLQVVTEERTYCIMAYRQSDRTEWMDHINAAMQRIPKPTLGGMTDEQLDQWLMGLKGRELTRRCTDIGMPKDMIKQLKKRHSTLLKSQGNKSFGARRKEFGSLSDLADDSDESSVERGSLLSPDSGVLSPHSPKPIQKSLGNLDDTRNRLSQQSRLGIGDYNFQQPRQSPSHTAKSRETPSPLSPVLPFGQSSDVSVEELDQRSYRTSSKPTIQSPSPT